MRPAKQRFKSCSIPNKTRGVGFKSSENDGEFCHNSIWPPKLARKVQKCLVERHFSRDNPVDDRHRQP